MNTILVSAKKSPPDKTTLGKISFQGTKWFPLMRAPPPPDGRTKVDPPFIYIYIYNCMCV